MTTTKSGWYWLLGSVTLISLAQLCLKFAMARLPGEPGVDTYLQMLEPVYLLTVVFPVLVGMASYTASVFCWITTLSRLPLSLAYPSLALSYLLVYLGATFLPFFNETTNVTRLIGVCLVVLGVWLVSRPPTDQRG